MGGRLSLHKPFGVEAAQADASPISRLPDSILHSVFMDVAAVEPIYDIYGYASAVLKPPSYYDCLGWTRLSSVCRRWRAVLLGAAQLWADVVFGLPPNMAVAVLALTRSGMAPLTMIIPSHKDRSIESLRELANKKKWGLPHTHRKRLLDLAVMYSHKMGYFEARDLSSQQYYSIFKTGMFDSLTFLILDYGYAEVGPIAPSREDLDDLRIIAPRVREAWFSPTFPMAYDDTPGLHLMLPALRKLKIAANFNLPTTIPTDVEQLRWIPTLICGTPTLEHLELYLPIHGLVVDWAELFNGKRGHLSALRVFDSNGRPDIHLDQLLDLVAPDVPQSTVVSLSLSETHPLEALVPYGSIIGRSMRLHSLDSVYLSMTLHDTPKDDDTNIACAPPSTFILAFPSCELSHLKFTPGYLLDHANLTVKAGLWSHSSSSLWPEPNVAPPDPSGDTLRILSPSLAQNVVKTLILDQVSSDHWADAMREVIQSCLPSVATLYCVNSAVATSTEKPCTAALRLLKPTNEDRARIRSPLAGLSHSHSAILPEVTQEPVPHSPTDIILPGLVTIVVTMDIVLLREPADVHAWWNEIIRALTYRHDVGLRVRVLTIVGGWTTEKLRKRTAKMDTKMLTQAGMLVDEVADERSVAPQVG